MKLTFDDLDCNNGEGQAAFLKHLAKVGKSLKYNATYHPCKN